MHTSFSPPRNQRLEQIAVVANAALIQWNGGRSTKKAMGPIMERLQEEMMKYKWQDKYPDEEILMVQS